MTIMDALAKLDVLKVAYPDPVELGQENGLRSLEPDPRLRNRQITPDLIAYIVARIVQAVSPKRVILFGSHARGEATSSSDLDLFIVQDSRVSNRQVRREIDRLLWGRRFGIDLIVRTPEDVARNVADGNPFYIRHLLQEGRVLYERPT
jgi:predicted nucleotidyltransferase